MRGNSWQPSVAEPTPMTTPLFPHVDGGPCGPLVDIEVEADGYYDDLYFGLGEVPIPIWF